MMLVASILVAFMAVVAAYLIGSMVRSIRTEKRRSGLRKTWSNFGLSIAFCILFLSSWAAHGVAEAVVVLLDPIRLRYGELRGDPDRLRSILAAGAEKAEEISSETLALAYQRIGFVPR